MRLAPRRRADQRLARAPLGVDAREDGGRRVLVPRALDAQAHAPRGVGEADAEDEVVVLAALALVRGVAAAVAVAAGKRDGQDGLGNGRGVEVLLVRERHGSRRRAWELEKRLQEYLRVGVSATTASKGCGGRSMYVLVECLCNSGELSKATGAGRPFWFALITALMYCSCEHFQKRKYK